MKILVATNNRGKLQEFNAILSGFGFEVIGLEDIGFKEEIEETGETFEENAIIKAETVMKRTGLCTIADDSGLVVDVLGGKPGIHSARYAEPGKRKLTVLKELSGVPEERRSARFVCVIACVFPSGETVTSRGVCEGRILTEARGEGGFGYDPIFYLPEQGMTFAEMSPTLKNEISHRAIAIGLMAEKLKGRL